MYRMLVTDIDYTLLEHPHPIHPRSIAALRRLHDEGVYVVFGSGRATMSTRGIMQSVFPDPTGGPRYMITFNGASIVDEYEGVELFSNRLPFEYMADVVYYARARGITVQGYTATGIVAESDEAHVIRYGSSVKLELNIVDDILTAMPESTPKLFLYADPAEQAALIADLRVHAAGRYTVTSSLPGHVEVLSLEVNKGDAMMRLADHLEIPICSVAAIGDNINDIELVRDAGLGVAVANARPELKEVADWITTAGAAEGAVAEMIEKAFYGNGETAELRRGSGAL